MTELEIVKYQLEQMKKVAMESQGAYHHAVNMRWSDRHVGKFADCQEGSCKNFFKAIETIDELPESYKRSYPDLVNKDVKI